jgi:hypothetical protein
MVTQILSENSLLDTEDKRQQMMQLITLKLATLWLEKQEWLTTPYGGQNPIQDFLFQTQLATQCVWDNFFSSEKKEKYTYNTAHLNAQIIEMSQIDEKLKDYLANVKIKKDL